ncbi:PREDICTED: putative methyltransferase KIAA1456 homolog, partial [Tauraco erythrolophus]|uniref:putative methyltransferase KIAA1456 homolog n=1 Tax=Tauraco erythrolophus TaxID=121530 RepID=UPI0005236A22
PRGILIHLICSVLVIHHFSTEERRMLAIKEMARISRVGGQIMIHVWAMEQKRRCEKQDVFVPWNPSPPSCSSGEPCLHGEQKSILHKDKERALNQPCHKLDGTSESFENTTAFEVAVKPVLPMSHCSKAFRSPNSEIEQATIQLSMAADTIHGCSEVCLPDLISHQKELAVRQQLKIDHHPNQGAFCQPQNKRTNSSLQKADRECALTVQRRQQTGPGGAWLRYYHVFKEEELTDLIEHHVPEIHITHSYFDHADWCVFAEKAEVWKI